MIASLAEAALRSLVLGGVVWFGLNLFRVRNPHVHMTAWVVVLLASLAMPFVMQADGHDHRAAIAGIGAG